CGWRSWRRGGWQCPSWTRSRPWRRSATRSPSVAWPAPGWPLPGWPRRPSGSQWPWRPLRWWGRRGVGLAPAAATPAGNLGLAGWVIGLSLALLPLAIAAAIARYRLYDL